MDFGILGELKVLQDGDLIELGSPRQRALLARLLISSPDPVPTDRLIDDLWHGEPPETARHALHVYISGLRHAMDDGPKRIERSHAGYRLWVEADELDSRRFEHLSKEGRSALDRNDARTADKVLSKALELWRGPPLCEFTDDRFAIDEASRLEELRLTTQEAKLWAELELGRHVAVIPDLQDLVAAHPFREAFWEQLMLALYRTGRQAEALRVFQSVRVVLANELGIEPGAALRIMEGRILSQDRGLLLDSQVPVADLAANLPPQRTVFVGRAQELDQAANLLDRSRLLTLTGPPGGGKTRLGIELARRKAASFAHGVVYVPLAAVDAPRHVAAAIATALGLHDVADATPLQTTKAHLAERNTLLILDNFEHVLDAAHEVGQIIDAAPGLTVLATSRAPLQIEGEQRFPIPPMHTPPLSMGTDLDAITTFDATSLFVTRAREVDPSFHLDAAVCPTVAAIAERLDGLPLAIELAAARIQFLTPADLLARLDRRLTLLTSGRSDGEARHQTMRNAIAWSYELLPPDEQMVFQRLGVFVGGFTLEAAAAVAEIDDMTAGNTVESLLRQNLLHRPVTEGPARYSMLELTREYATELLDLAGALITTRDRHARFYRRLATGVEPELAAEPGGRGRRTLEDEVGNLRAALSYLVTQGRPDEGIPLASAAWRFWQVSGRLTEGRDWLSDLLELPGADAATRAVGKGALAALAYWQADYEEARRIYEELVDYYRAIADKANEADALCSLSLTANWQKDIELGARLAAESRSIFEEIGSRQGMGRASMAQAGACLFNHDYESAYLLWMESLQIARESNDQALVLTQLAGLAALTHHLGRQGEAVEVAIQGLEEAGEVHHQHVIVWILDLIASFCATEAPVEAVMLEASAAALRARAGGGVLPEYLEITNARSVAEGAIDSGTLDDAWRAGTEMDLEHAVALARSLGRRLVQHPALRRGPTPKVTILSEHKKTHEEWKRSRRSGSPRASPTSGSIRHKQ